MTVLVSFIIPHKGRETMLARTLQSIAAQDFDPAQVEVILVTQNEKLRPDTCPDPALLPVVTLHRPPSDTISALRNHGARQARGEYLAFLDADVQLSPNWITAMLQSLQADGNRVLVSAVQQCAADAPPLEQLRTLMSNAATDCNVRFLPGRNLFLRARTFARVGGFPEHLVTCEDYYFTDQVHDLGDLYYTSAASYVHLGEDKEYREMFKKEIWRGQSNLQSIRGRRIPLSEWPSFLVPVWILLFALVTLLALVLGRGTVAVMALLLLLLPILLYSLRLKRLAGNRVGWWPILKFYLLYFPARIIGTYYGLWAVVRI
ncbi:MAG: glycosyl transferase family A [Pseudomonadales bacterium]|nr:glycosyl transferase family A [Pseudomonadales bacterium]MAR91589.1 glycosyl transferase family A [Pseudomonadales bacterium]